MSEREEKKSGAATDSEPILPDKIHSWPYFVRVEFIAGLIMLLFLIVWSLAIDAPLEEPANPAVTPNPSKAPWYFVGLQELLVYFDPWLAGVVFPVLIVAGLMVIPYVDINRRGNGYYTFKERWFAILVFLFGFHGLWVVPIFIGVFFRGPGWSFTFPWESWDPQRAIAATNIDWPELLGARSARARFAVGALTVGALYSLIPLGWSRLRRKASFEELGPVRYAIVSFLLLTMLLLPIKMLLRWTLNVKYLWVTPWFNV